MEMAMEKQLFAPKTTSSSALAMHKNSQTISKAKPKIRIIHIFAPEIIKTDAANFRELVQRLTGKPTDHDDPNKKKISRKKEPRIFPSSKKMEQLAMRAGLAEGLIERIKGEKEEEEEIWRDAHSGDGTFLGGFADQFDGFMQELNQFPFLEGTAQMMDAYGEGQLLA